MGAFADVNALAQQQRRAMGARIYLSSSYRSLSSLSRVRVGCTPKGLADILRASQVRACSWESLRVPARTQCGIVRNQLGCYDRAYSTHPSSHLVRRLLSSGTSGTASGRAGAGRVGARRSAAREAEIREGNKSFALWMFAVALGTVGLSYASVPLYRVFCQVTGFGGTVRRAGADGEDDEFETDLSDVEIVEGRPITVRFNGDVSARVPWRFTPSQPEVTILPGETALAFYVAENRSAAPITGIATYNVTPAKAGMYFNKVQCFCFDEQRLKPGEKLDMPVFFFLDPSLVEDEGMNDVKDITLSYTFFRAEDVSPEQLQQAQAAAMGY